MISFATSGIPHKLEGLSVSRLWSALRRLAEDFWHDGTENPLDMLLRRSKSNTTRTSLSGADVGFRVSGNPDSGVPSTQGWHALSGEISEIMWGAGNMMPGNAELYDKLITPLCLNKDMSVLDLSAGLGGHMRRASERYGAYFTGLEPDTEIAARGMMLSQMAHQGKRAPIKTYDPLRFKAERNYDCIIAREVFYRVVDKPRFFQALASSTKASAQIAFTDYILDSDLASKPAILAWMAAEPKSSPLCMDHMMQAWSHLGFRMHINENLTDYYRAEVLDGLKRLAAYLTQHPHPDAETRISIERHAAKWQYRMAAMEEGLLFCRFHGSK